MNYDPVSENGAFLVQWVELADGREGLLRRELSVGTPYCTPAVANSTGTSARILATGSRTAGGEPLRLIATQLPAQSFGLFFTGTGQAAFTAPGSQGLVCIGGGGSTGRFPVALNSGNAGQFELAIDTTAMPTNPTQAVLMGQSWTFKA